MKNLITALTLAALLITSVGLVQAKTISFTDPTPYWDIYTPTNNAQKQDYMGVPDLLGGTFSFNENLLKTITLEYKYTVNQSSEGISSWQAFAPGDWFFGSSKESWDYVLTTGSLFRNKDDITDLSAVRTDPTWYAYSYPNGLDYDDPKSYVNAGHLLYPDGWSGRTGHPALANLEGSVKGQSITFSGWLNTAPQLHQSYFATWTFSKGLELGNYGDSFYFGFSLTCANDVLYEKKFIPTPEPGTALLLGAGLLGLAAASRRRVR